LRRGRLGWRGSDLIHLFFSHGSQRLGDDTFGCGAARVCASVQVGVDEVLEFDFVEWIVDIEALVGDGSFKPFAVSRFWFGGFGVCGDGCAGEFRDVFDQGCGVGDRVILQFA